jgi:hypothetical protein
MITLSANVTPVQDFFLQARDMLLFPFGLERVIGLFSAS